MRRNGLPVLCSVEQIQHGGVRYNAAFSSIRPSQPRKPSLGGFNLRSVETMATTGYMQKNEAR